jgi:hypothetical protein
MRSAKGNFTRRPPKHQPHGPKPCPLCAAPDTRTTVREHVPPSGRQARARYCTRAAALAKENPRTSPR